MPIVTKSKRSTERDNITVKTQMGKPVRAGSKWWAASSKMARGEELIATAGFLKEQHNYRYRQASMFARLYSNVPLYGNIGSNWSKITPTQGLPIDRPTMNVVQSCVDTLVSRITQSRPRPVFLTDGGDSKARKLAKQMNNFIQGEFHQTGAYQLGPDILKDAAAFAGTGAIHIYPGADDKVKLERVLNTELLVDPNDSMYRKPRQLYRLKLIDRNVLAAEFPDSKTNIGNAEQAYVDSSSAEKSVSDLVLIVEGWHLPSGPESGDGLHMIACSTGVLYEEEWDKDEFPFVFLDYNPRLLGMWGQCLSEQLMGTQVEINKLLLTISKSINIVGVPRVFVENGSKVVKAHLNNEIGSIVTYTGTKPEYSVAPIVPQEMYAQLQRLVDYAYQQSGISALAAASQKPAGLDSGQAIREYDDLQSDRFAELNKRYDHMFIQLAYQIIDCAKEIAERTGSYQTVYPNKDGVKEIDLPAAEALDDPFVIQCFDASALPKDPAGRKQEIVDMMQAGLISPQEGRRLLDFPDLQQDQRLAMAAEERVLQYLDAIIEDGEYTPPDSFMDPQQAHTLAVQYYNLYVSNKLPEDRAEMLRTFAVQCQTLLAPPPVSAGMPLDPSGMAQVQPQAAPAPQPISPLVQNVPGAS